MKTRALFLVWAIAEVLRGYIVVADVLERVADLVDPNTGHAEGAEAALGMLDGVEAIMALAGPRGAGARFAESGIDRRIPELRASAAALIYAATWPPGADRVDA